MPKGGEGKYIHEVVMNKNKFDNRSFRIKTISKNKKLTIGCPNNSDGSSNWMPRKKRCKVGTRVQKKLTLKPQYRK